MMIFSTYSLDTLTAKAQSSPIRRQHGNTHESEVPCQHLFNAIEPDSYIYSHRHSGYSKDELLIVVRGLMALGTFDEQRMVIGVISFGADRNAKRLPVGAKVLANIWHTIIAIEPGCVFLEVKAGLFKPVQPKDTTPRAPYERAPAETPYLNKLIESDAS
jgi:cupin fold WbuC family metalloprotein